MVKIDFDINSGETLSAYNLPVRWADGEGIGKHADFKSLKLIYFKTGASRIEVNGSSVVVAGPAALCLNEMEQIASRDDFQAILFLPEVVNSSLSFSTLRRGEKNSLGISGILDYYWADPFLERPNAQPSIIYLPPAAEKAVENWFFLLKRELQERNNEFWPCRSRSFLMELLFFLGRFVHENPGALSEETSDVALYLQTRYHEKITLDALALHFHTNRTTLQKDFIRATGQTIGAYLQSLRLTIAKSLLSETKLPVGQIAEKTGFSDATHFGRIFRKAFGLNPSRFRSQNHSQPKIS